MVMGWDLTELLAAPEDLYCPACEKQFLKQAVYERHLNEKKHVKALALRRASSPSALAQARQVQLQTLAEKYKGMAQVEMLIAAYLGHLHAELEATKENVERKQTLTETELQEELEQEEDDEIDDDESEDEDKVYNPLKLPLGWDGKPIPYWLYKLHGLGIEYPCEICGNYVYMGRKAFERHFQEWRHAHGMKCLGIPNTRQFQEITVIEDALALWEKFKAVQGKKEFRPDVEEEFEDSEGNVFNRKTYEDLLRQGLL